MYKMLIYCCVMCANHFVCLLVSAIFLCLFRRLFFQNRCTFLSFMRNDCVFRWKINFFASERLFICVRASDFGILKRDVTPD